MVRSTAKHLVTWRLGNFFFFSLCLGNELFNNRFSSFHLKILLLFPLVSVGGRFDISHSG